MKRTAFISGHLDLKYPEFELHYAGAIDRAIADGDNFIVCDAGGTDTIAQQYLAGCCQQDNMTILHMFESPRNSVEGVRTIGGFVDDDHRDAYCTNHSDYDIAWVRPGREKSGTARNVKRRSST